DERLPRRGIEDLQAAGGEGDGDHLPDSQAAGGRQGPERGHQRHGGGGHEQELPAAVATSRSCRRRSARSAMVPAARPNRRDGSMRAAKAAPTASAPPPVSRASQAVAVRSTPVAPAEARVDAHSQRNPVERAALASSIEPGL